MEESTQDPNVPELNIAFQLPFHVSASVTIFKTHSEMLLHGFVAQKGVVGMSSLGNELPLTTLVVSVRRFVPVSTQVLDDEDEFQQTNEGSAHGRMAVGAGQVREQEEGDEDAGSEYLSHEEDQRLGELAIVASCNGQCARSTTRVWNGEVLVEWYGKNYRVGASCCSLTIGTM